MTKTPLVIAIMVLVAVFVFARIVCAQPLPTFAPADAKDEARVTKFVDSFLRSDPQARQLLNASNVSLYSGGYRPRMGVPHYPEGDGKKIGTLQDYFARKLYLDLHALQPLDEITFEKFVDEIGYAGDKTIMCTGNLAMKYRLNVDGRFIFDKEVQKVPAGAEREEFKRCWLNDAVLGTELRMLAWIYGELFGKPYVTPESRGSA